MTDVQLALGDVAASRGLTLLDLAPAGRKEPRVELEASEADYTSEGVAVACALVMRATLANPLGSAGFAPLMLDVGAGSGCWGRAMGAVIDRFDGRLRRTRLAALELRSSEAANLRTIFDEFAIGAFAGLIDAPPLPAGTVMCGNPPFRAFRNPLWPKLALQAHLGITDVFFLGLSSWGQSEEMSIANCWPSTQFRFGGRPSFCADGRTDARDYSLWHWRRGETSVRRWETHQLPLMPLHLRRHLYPGLPPGTQPITCDVVADVVAALGWPWAGLEVDEVLRRGRVSAELRGAR